MDRTHKKYHAVAGLPDSNQDDEASVRRMMRLYEDLEDLAAEIDPDDNVCLQIFQTPLNIHVAGGSSTPDIAPVLAAVLRAGLERRIAIAKHVRAELAPIWEALSKQH